MNQEQTELILELANKTHAVLPCSGCGKHHTRLLVSGAVEATQNLALEPWQQGKFDGFSWPQVAAMVREAIDAVPLECPECDALKDDDYGLRGLELTKTEELDDTAKQIFNHVEGFMLKEINGYLDEFQKERPDDRRIDFVKRWTTDVMSEIREAYAAEVAARRNAPVWQTKERKREKAELAFAHYQINSLSQRLQYYQSPERDRELAEKQHRLSMVEKVADLEKDVSQRQRLYLSGFALIFSAMCIDAIAFFAKGEIYKFSGGAVVYASAAITLLMPALLAAGYKDYRAALDRLRRYRHLADFESASAGREAP